LLLCVFFFNCIAVSLYGPLQRAAVRACYVPGRPVHLSFDFVILLGFERNKWRWKWSQKKESVERHFCYLLAVADHVLIGK